MKIFHNATIGKGLAIIFAIGIHLMFAVGAYYLGLFLAELILDQGTASLAAQTIAVGYAVSIFLGSMWAFVFGEYAKQDVRAYSSVNGGWGVMLFHILTGFIGLNELGSLGFRLTQVIDPSRRIWLGVAGLALLGIAYMLGKIIHAMANRPIQVQIGRMIDSVGRSYVNDVTRNAERLTAAEKLQVLQGNMAPLNEVRDVKEQERIAAERARLQAQEEKAMRKREEQESKEAAKRAKREEEAKKSQLAEILAEQMLQQPAQNDEDNRSPFPRSRRAQ